MERYVAIDNVCGWPKLTLMADGSINADIHNKPSHGSDDGSAECWKSTDGGRNFVKWGVSGQGDGNGSYIDKACGAAHNGDYLVIVQSKERARTFVFRSQDGGKHFTQTGTIESGREQRNMDSMPNPYGTVERLGEGVLAFTYWMNTEADWGTVGFGSALHEAHIRISRDDGYTWDEDYLIAEGINETAILFYDEQEGIAVGRMDTPSADKRAGRKDIGGGNQIYRTLDGGKTWSYEGNLLGQGMIPVHLLQLKSGQTLMTYGMRYANLCGIMVCLSEDKGATWKAENALVQYPGVDSGYPSTVQLEDGTLVTAYYCGGNMYHTRYHVGVIRWQLSDMIEGRWIGRPAKFHYGTQEEHLLDWRIN